MSDLIRKYQQEINQVCQNSGITYLAVFGSEARGEARGDSDVDLLVEFRDNSGLNHLGTVLEFIVVTI